MTEQFANENNSQNSKTSSYDSHTANVNVKQRQIRKKKNQDVENKMKQLKTCRCLHFQPVKTNQGQTFVPQLQAPG